MLTERFGFSDKTAGIVYSLPYFMSAVLSPLLGFAIDKVGKRALFIMTSSILVILACLVTTLLSPETPYNEETGEGTPNWMVLLPLIFMGVGYSIYASALWGSVPYVVEPKTIGSAFGLTTAVQNLGLSVAPLLIGVEIDNTKSQDGYFWSNITMALLAGIGLCANVILYYDDINNRGGVLNKVDKSAELKELMTSPPPGRRDGPDDGEIVEGDP